MIENKIVEAINKSNVYETIDNLNKYSAILILILIICAGIFLYYENNLYSKYLTILSLFKNIIQINYCNKIGLYFIRELTILNIPDTGLVGGKYVDIPSNNRAEYIEFVRKNVLDLFIESQLAMSDFIKATLPISKYSENLLSETKLITKLTNNNLRLTLVENNIIINIVQLNSAFYNLASSTSPVEQNHADLYNYVYNSLNNFSLALNILINTYRTEIIITSKYYQIIFEIQLLIYLVVYIIIYIIAIFLYSKVVQKKKSYMKVFLNINNDFISLSINKCEKFINKFNLGEDNNKEAEIDDIFDENNSLIKPEKKFKDSHTILKKKSLKLNNNNGKRKKKFKCSKNKLFKIFFGIFLFITYILYFILGFFWVLNMNKTSIYISNFFFYLQYYHLTIFEYYNIYREYLYDNGSIISNQTPYENLVSLEKEIFANWTNVVNNIAYYKKLFINNKNILNQFNKPLCSYNTTGYFQSEPHCIFILGNSYNQDIDTFAYGFLDEIRIKKNIIRVLIEANKIIGNLTEYETGTWYEKYNDLLIGEIGKEITDKIFFRLELFNQRYFHMISNVYFINVILPCLNEHKKIILGNVTLEGKQTTFYILLFVLLALFISIYIFYWAPMLKNLNKIIYETKSMLKIIPIYILMVDTNIKNLLDISVKK